MNKIKSTSQGKKCENSAFKTCETISMTFIPIKYYFYFVLFVGIINYFALIYEFKQNCLRYFSVHCKNVCFKEPLLVNEYEGSCCNITDINYLKYVLQ